MDTVATGGGPNKRKEGVDGVPRPKGLVNRLLVVHPSTEKTQGCLRIRSSYAASLVGPRVESRPRARHDRPFSLRGRLLCDDRAFRRDLEGGPVAQTAGERRRGRLVLSDATLGARRRRRASLTSTVSSGRRRELNRPDALKAGHVKGLRTREVQARVPELGAEGPTGLARGKHESRRKWRAPEAQDNSGSSTR